MQEQMFRQLIRDRLSAGVDTASIRAELQSLGLDAEQISSLARQVAVDETPSKYAGVEKLYEWLPLVMLIPGSAALAVMGALMPRQEFGYTCILAGAAISFVCWRLARVVASVDSYMARSGIMFFRAELQMIENPKKYWKLLAAVVIGWVIMFVGGIALAPYHKSTNRSQSEYSSSFEE